GFNRYGFLGVQLHFTIGQLISTALAASIVAGSASAISSLAASPKIFINFVYKDSDTIRADVMFEGMPELSSVGIHIQFGEGYDVVLSSSGKPMMFF
ncbi:MAG: hypothetical protein LUG26_01990, partial [Ruminococcus sp.]|nr:hypothetical protein [Ruminococcus sp.]